MLHAFEGAPPALPAGLQFCGPAAVDVLVVAAVVKSSASAMVVGVDAAVVVGVEVVFDTQSPHVAGQASRISAFDVQNN